MNTYKIRFKGGAGSGFHGHRGRPGERGGSLPEGSSASVSSTMERRFLTKDTLIKKVSTAKGVFEIHKRNGRMYILSPDGSIQPSGINSRDSEEFIYRFMAPKADSQVTNSVTENSISWDHKDVLDLNKSIKAWSSMHPELFQGTEKKFYESVQKLLDKSGIKLDDGQFDELGIIFDSWVPEKFGE